MTLGCFAVIAAALHLIWRELRRLDRTAHVRLTPLQVAATPRERFNQALHEAEEAPFGAVR